MEENLNRQDKKLFSYKINDDGYQTIYLKGNAIAHTKDEEDAILTINELYPLTNWNKIKSISDAYEKLDMEEYEVVVSPLRKRAIPLIFNGNYEKHTEGAGLEYVKYRLQNMEGLQFGIELSKGLAYRVVDDIIKVDAIYAGKCIANFDVDEDHLVDEFADYVTSLLSFNHIKEVVLFFSNAELSKVVYEASIGLKNGRRPEKPDDELYYGYKFDILSVSDERRKRAYIDVNIELDNMLGLKMVKDKMRKLYSIVIVDKMLEEQGMRASQTSLHSMFLGNPGTGKTVVARLYAKFLWSIGIIEKNVVVEKTREHLVSSNVGGTEEKTIEVLEQAKGGVLFIDEAYTLYSEDGRDSSQQAIDAIMKYMEDHRGELVVIFAGYVRETYRLLQANPGLESRVSQEFLFEDYTTEELTQITKIMIESHGFDAGDVTDELSRVVRVEQGKQEINGNARLSRNISERIIESHKEALYNESGNGVRIAPKTVLSLLALTEAEELEEKKEEAKAKLDALIGLDSIKDEVNTWTNLMKIEKKRFDAGMTTNSPMYHMTFEGNPGTGKTTVARIIGELLRYNGVLSRGHFTEASRSDLVGGYVGQTATKVKNLVRSAAGGVLFIDEAYSLAPSTGRDSFGEEAISQLILEMENRRDDLVVILAGYTDEMEELLTSNPGFKSRISNRFVFSDYNAVELTRLLVKMTNDEGFELTKEAIDKVEELMEDAHQIGEVDGNGRWVRNLFEQMKRNQANRLVETGGEDLSTLVEQDIKKPG